MEIRKVQVTGGSSYIISLPKRWINSMNIKKNDPVGIVIQDDGTLLITAKTGEELNKRIKEFGVENFEKPSSLIRLLIGSYISGYNVIKIKAKDRMLPWIRSVIRDFTDKAIGVEIVEETSNQMIIKDILDPKEMPPLNSIKRMYVIVSGMHRDAITSLVNRDRKLAEDVIARDEEIDRLHWLIARQHNMISKDASLAHRMSIQPAEALNHFMVSRLMERIGDHAVRISRNVMSVIDERIERRMIDSLVESSNMSLKILNQSMNSFLSKDIHRANESIEMVPDLISRCEEANEIALQYKGKVAISLGYIIESIRRTGEYAVDLAENVINYLV